MTDRYRRDDPRTDRLSQPQNYPDMPRQPEQYADYSGQHGDSHDDSRTRWRDTGQSFRDEFDDHAGGRPVRFDSGRQGTWTTDRGSTQRSPVNRGERDERGFLDKAGDEIASWFGDDSAARRRQQDHRGHGPANYTRSDDRIREDANDRLTDDRHVDARKVTVTVDGGEVTLDGTVDSREAKRRAEDCVDCISGVKHVQNNLRIDANASNADPQATSSWSGTTA